MAEPGGVTVSVTHHPIEDAPPPAPVHLTARSCDPGTRTHVVVGMGGETVVSVDWEQWEFVAERFHHLLTSEGTLFLAAGTLCAAVALEAHEVRHESEELLVWRLERRGPYVLLLGEVGCSLFTPEGLHIDSVPVDPPYEVQDSDEGIVFESLVEGTHVLRYPRPLGGAE